MTYRVTRGSTTAWARRGFLLLSSVVALASVVLLGLAGTRLVGYAAASPVAAASMLLAGLLPVAAGWAADADGRTGALGALVAAGGAAWLAPLWVGLLDGAAVVRSLAMMAAPFLLPVILHVSVATPTGYLERQWRRALVATGYAATVITVTLLAMFRDPFRDVHCWINCTDNVFLVRPLPWLADGLSGAWTWAAVLVATAVTVFTVVRLASATAVARKGEWPLLAASTLALIAEAVHTGLRTWTPPETADDPVYLAVFFARSLAMVAVALGLAWIVYQARRRQRAVARLVEHLGEVPPVGSLQAALGAALGDPRLAVAYWLPGSRRYVDAEGQAADVATPPDRAVTTLTRQGDPVAVVTHDRSVDADQLAGQIGAAARLAVDNERLQAELLAQLADLRASRARVVGASDEARRSLERDLHDGAQQSLLSLVHELRMAGVEARSQGDEATAAAVASLVAEAAAAVDELRSVAHGIFPAVLDESGLAAAVWSLTDVAPLAVDIVGLPPGRLPDMVERATYVVIDGAIEAAAASGVEELRLLVDERGDDLVIEIDGVPAGDHPQLADRVAIVEGRLTSEEGRLRVVIPCG